MALPCWCRCWGATNSKWPGRQLDGEPWGFWTWGGQIGSQTSVMDGPINVWMNNIRQVSFSTSETYGIALHTCLVKMIVVNLAFFTWASQPRSDIANWISSLMIWVCWHAALFFKSLYCKSMMGVRRPGDQATSLPGVQISPKSAGYCLLQSYRLLFFPWRRLLPQIFARSLPKASCKLLGSGWT